MKKRIGAILICMVLVLTMFPLSATAGTEGGISQIDQEYTSFATAPAIELNQKLSFHSMADEEWDGGVYHFKIVLPEDGYIYCNEDFHFEVYQSQNTEDPFSSLKDWKLGLAAGTYFLTADFPFDETVSFTIHYTPDANWEKEANNDFDHANQIGADHSVIHGVTHENEDYYTFTLAEPGYIQTGLSYQYHAEDIEQGRFWRLAVFSSADEASHLITVDGDSEESSDTREGCGIDHLGLRPGTYYLRVDGRGYNSADWNYDLQLDFTPNAYYELEPNDVPESANPINLNQDYVAKENIGNDYFLFTLPKDGKIMFTVTGDQESDYRFNVLDGKEYDETIFLGGVPANTKTTSEALELSAGTYYLRTEANDSVLYTFCLNEEGEGGPGSGDSGQEIRKLTLNTATAVSSEYGSPVVLEFTPTATLRYKFVETDTEEKVLVDIREADGSPFGSKNNTYGNPGNYYRIGGLDKGKTYYLYLEKENNEAFSCTLTPTIEGVPISIHANGGYFKSKTGKYTERGDSIDYGGTYDPSSHELLHDDPNMVFVGWYTEAVGGEVFDPTKALYEAADLYAHWQRKSYPELHLNTEEMVSSETGEAWFEFTPSETGTYRIVTSDNGYDPKKDLAAFYPMITAYDSQNSKLSGNLSTEEGDNVKLLCDLTAGETYFFCFTDRGSSLPFTYKAKLGEVEELTVTLNANDGWFGNTAETVKSQKYESGDAFQVIIPTHSLGFRTFVGWYTDPVAGVKWEPNCPVTESRTLYAHWSDGENPVIQPEVFNSVGGSKAGVWYSFTPKVNGRHKILTEESKVHPYVEVYNAKGEMFFSSTAEAPDNNLNCIIVFEAGQTYYLKLGKTDSYGTSISYYDIKIFDWDNRIAVTGVTIDHTAEKLEKGKTLQLTATVSPFEAADGTVKWTTSNDKVATVDQTGKVTAVDNGVAQITVTTTDGNKTAVCQITVGTVYTEHIPGTQEVENRVWEDCETAGGYDEVTYCTDCGIELSRNHVTVPALGHDYVADPDSAVPATCENDGREPDQQCSRCYKVIKGGTIAASGHRWGDWAMVKEPTTTEPGLKKRICQNDPSHEETSEIPPTGQTDPIVPFHPDYAFGPVLENPEVIWVGGNRNATLTKEGDVVTYSFRPNKTGMYWFTAKNEGAEACVFTATELNDSSINNSFAYAYPVLCFYAEEGEVYYFQVRLWNSEYAGNCEINVSEREIEGDEDCELLQIGEKEYEVGEDDPLPKGMSYDSKTGTLTLTDCRLDLSGQENAESYLRSEGKLNIVLKGNNEFTGLSGRGYQVFGLNVEGALHISGGGTLTVDMSGVQKSLPCAGIMAAWRLDIDGATINIKGSTEPRTAMFYGMSLSNTWENAAFYRNTTGKGIFGIRLNNATVHVSNTASNTDKYSNGDPVIVTNIGIDSQDADLSITNHSDVELNLTGGKTWGIGAGLYRNSAYNGGRVSIDNSSRVKILLRDTHENIIREGSLYAMYFWENDIHSNYVYIADAGQTARLADDNMLQSDHNWRIEVMHPYVEFSPTPIGYYDPGISGTTPTTHKMEYHAATEAGCKTAGNSEYWYCSDCGKYFSDEVGNTEIAENSWVLPALGHSFTKYESNNDATCTADGTKTAVCDRCDAKDTVKEEGTAKGHTEVKDPAVAAICTKTGKTEGSHCSVCNEVIKAQTEIPALGHSFKETTVPATMKGNGKITKECERCHDQSVTTIYKIKTAALSKTKYTYNKSVQKPDLTIKDEKGKKIDKKYYTVTYSDKNSKSVGTYKVTVRFSGRYAGKKVLNYSINKADNPLTIKVSKKNINVGKGGKFNIGVSKAEGKVKYTPNAKAKKCGIIVTAKGKVTIPKSCKKGNYKITVTAAGNSNYKTVSKTVTVTVR